MRERERERERFNDSDIEHTKIQSGYTTKHAQKFTANKK